MLIGIYRSLSYIHSECQCQLSDTMLIMARDPSLSLLVSELNRGVAPTLERRKEA